MEQRRPIRMICGGAVGVALLVGGCSAASSGTGPNNPSPPDSSPLAEYWNAVWGTDLSPAERARRDDEAHTRREEMIAQCMNEAGFTYIPIPPMPQQIYDPDDWRPDDRQWVMEYGYGQLVAPEGWQPDWGLTVEIPADPNQEIIANLSDAERRAYTLALHGPARHADDPVGEGDRGCNGVAWDLFNASRAASLFNSEEFAPLFEAWEAARIEFGSQITDADLDWVSCMADAGYPGFTRQDDALQSFMDEKNQLFSRIGDHDWVALGPPTPANHPAWAELHDREIPLALADLDCREATNFTARQDARTFEFEAQFLNDHRAAFNALRDAAEQFTN